MNHATIQINETRLSVAYDYTPECKGSRDRWGQPVEPDTPAELEITNLEIESGSLLDLLVNCGEHNPLPIIEDEVRRELSEKWLGI